MNFKSIACNRSRGANINRGGGLNSIAVLAMANWRRAALALTFLMLTLSVGVRAYEYMQAGIGARVSIVAPQSANIAIIPGLDTVKGPGASAHNVCYVNSSSMIECDFGPWARGMTFKAMAAFNVTNYDDETWVFWFETSGLPSGVSLTFYKWTGSSWTQITQSDPLTLDSDETGTVGVMLSIGPTAPLGSDQAFTVQMQGMEQGASGTPSSPGSPES